MCSSDMQAGWDMAAWQKYSRKHIRSVSLPPTHTFASLMHVCSLSLSPTSDLPRERSSCLQRPSSTPSTLLACSYCFACLPARSCHSNNTQHRSAAYTRLDPPRDHTEIPHYRRLSYLTSARLDTSQPHPSTPRNISLSARALLPPRLLPPRLPKPSHIPLYVLGHHTR
jgi:hypothetical protein